MPKNEIQEVKAWRFAGTIYPNKKDAERAVAKLDLYEYMNGHAVGRGGEWDQDMIVAHMYEHAEEYAELLLKIARSK